MRRLKVAFTNKSSRLSFNTQVLSWKSGCDKYSRRQNRRYFQIVEDKDFLDPALKIAGNQTHLQIGALDSVPKSVILSLVMEAYKISPQCTVSILEGRGDKLFRELYTHKIDLILSNYPPPAVEQKQVYSKSVAKLPVAIFCAPSFRKLKKFFPSSLNGQPFVLPTAHSKLRHDLNHYFKLQNIHVVPTAETQDTSLQKLLAKQGIRLAPLSEVAAESLLNDDTLQRLGTLKGVYEEIFLVSTQRKLENQVTAKLIKTFTLY